VGRAARLTAPGLALLAALGPGRRADAQRARPEPAAAVRLELHPRPGDTVRTRFEQTVQLFARDADGGERGAGMASSMTVLGHSVVERVEAAGAVIVAVTDSVALRASGAPARATEAARRGMQGRRSRVGVAPDGATAVLGHAGGAPRSDPGPSPLRFPATLPAGPVAPGAMWSRAVTVPWGGARGPRTAAGSTIDVWFRFDSLARGGAVAHLSLRGTVHSVGAAGRAAPASAGGGSSVAGAIVVDRARGWVVDSRMTFELDGVIAAPGGAPRPARVVVTQRLRVL
jgi:hypothetical protein